MHESDTRFRWLVVSDDEDTRAEVEVVIRRALIAAGYRPPTPVRHLRLVEPREGRSA